MSRSSPASGIIEGMTDSLSLVGLLGDVHAQQYRLDAALELFDELGVDAVLCVGDIADGPGDLDKCCTLLDQGGVHTVRGNHERWLLADSMRQLPDAHRSADLSQKTLSFLAGLPATRDFMTERGPLLLCHGLGEDDMNGIKPDDHGYGLQVNDVLQSLIAGGRYRFVVNGHTHVRMVRRFGQMTIINAGTLLGDHDPCVAVADFARGDVIYYDFAAGETSLTLRGTQSLE